MGIIKAGRITAPVSKALLGYGIYKNYRDYGYLEGTGRLIIDSTFYVGSLVTTNFILSLVTIATIAGVSATAAILAPLAIGVAVGVAAYVASEAIKSHIYD